MRDRENAIGHVFGEKYAAARSRTWDNLGNNQVLYQLSYGGTLQSFIPGYDK